MAKKPLNNVTPEQLQQNVLARLAEGVDYNEEMERLARNERMLRYNALMENQVMPQGLDPDLYYAPQIAGLMAKMNRPMPTPAGDQGLYTAQQYQDAVQQAYPYDPIQQQLDLDARMRQQEVIRQQMRMTQPGSMIGIRAQQRMYDEPLPQSSFLGGRDLEPGFLNRLRAMLGY
jgi:hypothetical protein